MSYTQKRHSRTQNRANTYKYIKRRIHILNNSYDGVRPNIGDCSALNGFTNGGEWHRLDKAKLHCSCPMCRQKTKEIGWKHSDKVKLAKGGEY